MTPTNPELRQFITQYFSDEELEALCFDYFPEALNDFGGGMSKGRKVIALIGHCERRGRLPDLHAALERERAEAWKGQFATGAAAQKPGFSEKTWFLNERDPRQIFLSHATADAEFAHRLAADLRQEGWQVWIAPESIRPGEKWVEAIDRGLETSGVFVVMLTPDAVASRWVNTETDMAVEMQHEGVISFIPLDVVASQPKRLWRQYQYISFRGSYEVGLDALLRRLDDVPLPTIHSTPQPTIDQPAKAELKNVELLKKQPDEIYPGNIFHAPEFRIHEKTGIELVRIPAGQFLFGSTDAKNIARHSEKPQRTIDLPEYWIGRYPVTNAQYKRFVDATNHAAPSNWTGKNPLPNKLDHPVVQVSWEDAKAFCDWSGLSLPSEEQWEKAARGTDGRIWPWGDESPAADHCNFAHNVGDTTPVGSYSPLGDSPYGCADLAGNVWEWTSTWSTWILARRILKGGSWDMANISCRSTSRRGRDPFRVGNDVGFRVLAPHLDIADL